MGWSEQDLIDRERHNRQVRRAVAEHLSAELSPCHREPNYEADRVYRVTRANQERAVKASGALRIPKGMNKTETHYQQHLDLQKRAGAVLWYKFEGMTFKLADDTRYTPDFAVLGTAGLLELHEVKAASKGTRSRPRFEDDARVKIACAAEQFPCRFMMVWPAHNGEWDFKEF